MSEARARSIGEPIGLASPLPVDPRALGEQQALGEGEHLDGEADVDRELEREPLTAVADVRRGAELPKDRLDPTVGLFVAPDDDRQRSRLHLRDAPRHRRVEHPRARGLHSLRYVAACRQADGARVNPRLACG